MLRVITEIKPSWVVGENVAGLLSLENGKTFDRILTSLEDEGYTVESFIIPACAIGAWHKRDRIWIIANSVCIGSRKIRTFTKNDIRQVCKNGIFKDVSDTEETECKQSRNTRTRGTRFTDGNWWAVEPELGRVAHGIPNRVDRLKGLGNSIVPQIAFELFKAIEYESSNISRSHSKETY